MGEVDDDLGGRIGEEAERITGVDRSYSSRARRL
jgi:hypothetical protein